MIAQLVDRYKHWRYKNSFLLILSLTAFIFLARKPFVIEWFEALGNVNYFGAFVAGLFCASTFTIAPAILLLISLTKHFNPVAVATIAAIGCTIGDYLTMKLIKDEVFEELKPILNHFKPRRLLYLFHTPYFAWLVPVIGAVLIVAPGPDEIGLALLGFKKFKDWQLLTLLFIINIVGMAVFVGTIGIVLNTVK